MGGYSGRWVERLWDGWGAGVMGMNRGRWLGRGRDGERGRGDGSGVKERKTVYLYL